MLRAIGHGERTFTLIARAAGALNPLLAVTRSGCTAEGVQHVGPEDLLEAWR